MKGIWVASATILTALAGDHATAAPEVDAPPAAWQASAGLGGITTAWSLGAKRQRYLVIPAVDLRYADWFFANPMDGVGVTTDVGGLTATLAIAPDLAGRDPEAGGRYAGLSRKSPSPALRMRLGYEVGKITTAVQLSSRFGDRERSGDTLELQAGYRLAAQGGASVTVGLFGRWVDDRFAQNLISLSPADARDAGLPAYRASAGLLQGGLYGQAVMRISDAWTGFAVLEVSRLGHAMASAPYVERNTGTTLSVFASRVF